jgi:hypothetical protein
MLGVMKQKTKISIVKLEGPARNSNSARSLSRQHATYVRVTTTQQDSHPSPLGLTEGIHDLDVLDHRCIPRLFVCADVA